MVYSYICNPAKSYFSLGVHAQKEPPFHFMTFRDVIGVAPRLSVRTSGRPKDHGDSSQPSTSFVLLEFCFFGEILNCDQHNYPSGVFRL
jgi:hypothetical protein